MKQIKRFLYLVLFTCLTNGNLLAQTKADSISIIFPKVLLVN
ncbi:MAG: hypothetical protein RLY16_2175, partial [Bacteroidota bacterium]